MKTNSNMVKMMLMSILTAGTTVKYPAMALSVVLIESGASTITATMPTPTTTS